MELVKCPFCEEDIEKDSVYCDQCGKALNVCPKCGQFRRGKFCPNCGVQTIGAQSYTPSQNVGLHHGAAAPDSAPSNTPQSREAFASSNPVIGGTSVASNAQQATKLNCRSLGIVIPLQAGAIIGRVNGNYASILGSLRFLSSTHARVDFNAGQWTLTDLGSTNGTTVNGYPCTPTASIKVGDIIRFAKNYDFYVE